MRLVKSESYTIVPPIPSSPGIPPSQYCPPCTITPSGGSGPGSSSGGNANPTDPGGPKQTCIQVPTGSTCVIVNGTPVGVNCQTIYTTICR